ncbi:hypothetical protein GOP47_0008458 [Adiantum capillus-veneris]|uniref:TF-B3 domain-containing protein n=1 Tax=Adiantum capillus-veneris TaxID=13818 RepID=A0A9D4UYM0_ADICA|nr:hypothetical protein GOP47_0008458 [Adiantum capillus-veneris]
MGATKTSSSYEDARLHRLEDNKRRLEELGLAGMSRSISAIFKKTKTFSSRSPLKRCNKLTIPNELLESRRSSRIAQKPAPLYRDLNDDFPTLRRSAPRRGASVRQRWCSYISDQARDAAADAVSCIETSHPSFVKRMLPSHVSSCFWLGLPLSFCKAHLPKHDQYMKLVNEQGKEWESLYLARKTGLSAGWKRFAEDNELRDGDALLFDLVQDNQFNVRIVRVAGYEEMGHEDWYDEDGDGEEAQQQDDE